MAISVASSSPERAESYVSARHEQQPTRTPSQDDIPLNPDYSPSHPTFDSSTLEVPPSPPSVSYSPGNSDHPPLTSLDVSSPLTLDGGPETPTRPKAVHSYNAYCNIDQARIAMLLDAGKSVKELEAEAFLKHVLPSLDASIDIADVERRLRSGSKPILDHDGWVDLAGRNCKRKKNTGETVDGTICPPKDRTDMEDTVYEPLTDIITAIMNAVPKPRNFAYTQQPTKSPACTAHKVIQKPDGYGHILHLKGDPIPEDPKCDRVYWRRIVVSAEFKKSDVCTDDHNEVVAQICGDMLQTMRDDPARRFTYGFTLENFTMRMWYCNRSELVVSTPFNMMKSYGHLIHFILALAFASSLDLGFDPTMIGPIDGNFNYDVSVPCGAGKVRTFRTRRLISAEGARALRGRATRVWEAQEVIEGKLKGPPVALKDVWIECSRIREGDIIAKIMEEATELWQAKNLENGLLTVVCHGDVRISEEKKDETLAVKSERRFALVRPLANEEQVSRQNTLHRETLSSMIDVQYKISDFPVSHDIDYEPRTHYRIVYGQVGVPLNKITQLDDGFGALYTAALALFTLHSLGWVHRDVSASNIIWDLKHGRLADLEYAQKETRGKAHSLRTASTFFQPVEIMHQRYVFLPDSTVADMTPSETNIRELDYIPRGIVEDEASRTPSDAVNTSPSHDDETPSLTTADLRPRYNPLHDLESLWWIAVYLLYYKDVKVSNWPDRRIPTLIVEQHKASRLLFEEMRERSRFLGGSQAFAACKQSLQPSVRPLWAVLDGLRRILVERSQTLQRDLQSLCFKTILEDSDVHTKFVCTFQLLNTKCKGFEVLAQRRQDKEIEALEESARPGHTAVAITNALDTVTLQVLLQDDENVAQSVLRKRGHDEVEDLSEE